MLRHIELSSAEVDTDTDNDKTARLGIRCSLCVISLEGKHLD